VSEHPSNTTASPHLGIYDLEDVKCHVDLVLSNCGECRKYGHAFRR